MLARLPSQRRLPYAPRERIEARRDARLRHAVRYAARTVPHYRDLFRRLGLDARDIATPGDLVRLPILEKEEVRLDPERWRSTTRRGRAAVPFLSSGSSGRPVRIYHDRRSLLANIAYGERERQVIAGMLGRRFGYREAVVGYPGGTMRKVRAFYRENTFLWRPIRHDLSVLDPLSDTAGRLNALRPDVIAAFGNYLAAMGRAVQQGTLTLHRPALFVYSAEGLRREVRQEIEGTLGAPLISFYNAVEAFKIGFLCEAREGFHLHEDLCHVRIVDEEGRDVPDGTAGYVVLSNLVNRGTVLLNYRLGDIASFATRPCSCGRTLRCLADVEGRVEDMLPLPDGRILHPRAVWGVVQTHVEIVQYQLEQRQPHDFVLRIVTAGGDDGYRRVAPAVARELETLLGAATRVTTERHERLVAEQSGKVRLVVALPRTGET